MSVRCPVCESDDVHRSRSASPWWFYLLRGFTVRVRCGNCGELFHARGKLLWGSTIPQRRRGPSFPGPALAPKTVEV